MVEAGISPEGGALVGSGGWVSAGERLEVADGRSVGRAALLASKVGAGWRVSVGSQI
jgi:hypothetical protein